MQKLPKEVALSQGLSFSIRRAASPTHLPWGSCSTEAQVQAALEVCD